MVSSLADFYNEKVNDRSIIAFIGTVTPSTIDTILAQMEDRMNQQNENIKTRRKLYNVFLESLQNLYHHNDTEKVLPQKPSSICIVDESDEEYSIITGNYIQNKKIEMFKANLDRINNFTKEELKKYYLETLSNGIRSEKDGAGLGIIEIARKTDDKLKYEFLPVISGYSLFILNVKVFKKVDYEKSIN